MAYIPPAKPAALGWSDSHLVQCQESKHHGFHPCDEECKYCDPAEVTAKKAAAYDSYADWYNRWHDLP